MTSQATILPILLLFFHNIRISNRICRSHFRDNLSPTCSVLVVFAHCRPGVVYSIKARSGGWLLVGQCAKLGGFIKVFEILRRVVVEKFLM